jgi:predicted GNAT family N-acyltransferase
VELQRVAYGVEAELIGYASLPPLADTPPDIMASNERFFGTFDADSLAGMIACEETRDGLLISRLCVHPDHARLGVGSGLVRHVVAQAGSAVSVTTAQANHPAIALYTRLGFQPISHSCSADGLALVTLRRGRSGPPCPSTQYRVFATSKERGARTGAADSGVCRRVCLPASAWRHHPERIASVEPARTARPGSILLRFFHVVGERPANRAFHKGHAGDFAMLVTQRERMGIGFPVRELETWFSHVPATTLRVETQDLAGKAEIGLLRVCRPQPDD